MFFRIKLAENQAKQKQGGKLTTDENLATMENARA